MTEVKTAEFFAGIGLMRLGLEAAGITTSWANDIEVYKRDLYVANFGADGFALGDVRDVTGDEVPTVDLATASFPCTDLSLAGNRKGLGANGAARGGKGGSSMFWEFARVLAEMGKRRPAALLLENVLGFASSHGGRDLSEAVARLNNLGYSCDLLAIDARRFVPQSRPRMFIVGLLEVDEADAFSSAVDRPGWVNQFVADNREARVHARRLPPLPEGPANLAEVVETDHQGDLDWWDGTRLERFLASLSPIQAARLDKLRAAPELSWRTAYRRTRNGTAVWEIRADGIAGCLRTARGGSSKQALVESGAGGMRVRWMTPREYARLMGAPDFKLEAPRNQALFGFGDAVCVPVVTWLCEHYLSAALGAPPSLALAA
jgi:DNA (cytosine-5)-methyltransferase 1